jgi:hypothetical protein
MGQMHQHLVLFNHIGLGLKAEFLEAFSPKRLMFGSDWPVVTLASSYRRWLSTVRLAAAQLSTDERNWIFGKTAIEAYRLGVPNSLWGEPLVTVPGIQLYTVDKELKADVDGTLKKVRSIGYQEVETAGLVGCRRRPFALLSKTLALKCSSSHFFDFGSADPAPLFEEANTLGVHYTVTSAMSRFTDKPVGQVMGSDDYKTMACSVTNWVVKLN